ncbi:MAG: DUF4430 domain-containing protein [Candidatus Binatia bacterium]
MEEIGGVRSDPVKDRWWYFGVNGYRSNVAAERYLVRRGDRIKWLYLATPKSSAKPLPGAKEEPQL